MLSCQIEINLKLILLTPFYQFRFEINLLPRYLLQIQVLIDDAFFHELLARTIATIQINGTYQRLESIATHIAVVRRLFGGIDYHLIESNLYRHPVQRITLHYLRASVCKKALSLTLEFLINDIGYYSIQDSVAQELQAFVVKQTPFSRLDRRWLMQ